MHAVRPLRILLMWLVLLILLGGVSGVSRPLNHAWVYDALRRLTEEGIETESAGPVGAVQYGPIVSGNTQSGGYDRVGNRQNREVTGDTLIAAGVTQVMNSFNVLDQPSGAPFTFDAAGNTTSDGTGVSYDYDSDNRLIRKLVNDQNKVEFQYDADGNRVKKTVTANGVQNTVLYLVDDRNPTGYAQVMEELPATGTTSGVSYVYGLDLISQTRGGQTRYYGYDGLGSVRYLTDVSGAVTDTFTYDAFGILIDRRARNASGTLVAFANPALETPPAGISPVINNYRYTGEQWDPDLGTYYLRARYYSPQIGRFWTMDSYEGRQGDPLSLHKYLYAADNPVNRFDPSGHESVISVVSTFTWQFALRTTQFVATHPIYATLGAIVVSTAFPQLEAIPPGHPSPLDEMGQVGRIIRQGITKGLTKVVMNNNHPLPKFLGGDKVQNYIRIPRHVHEAFHKILHERLQAKGFPLGGLGGVGNSTADWARHFQANPGSQTKAFEAVLEASRAIDVSFGDEIAQTGTTMTRAVWQNIIEGNFTAYP